MALTKGVVDLVHDSKEMALRINTVEEAQRIEYIAENPRVAAQHNGVWMFLDVIFLQQSLDVVTQRFLLILTKILVMEAKKIPTIVRK